MNIPKPIVLFFGPEFFVWFFFHFFLALGLSFFAGRLLAIYLPLAFLGLVLAFGVLVIGLSKERKMWARAVLTYPKRVNYLDNMYAGIGSPFAFFVSVLIFGTIYLDRQLDGFLAFVFILTGVFLIFFVNTNLRSPKRTLRQLKRLSSFRKSVWGKRFSRNLVIGLVLLAVFGAGLFRFEHLATIDNLTKSVGSRSEAVGLIGFVGERPITTTRDGPCRRFFIDSSDTTFSSHQCPASPEVDK